MMVRTLALLSCVLLFSACGSSSTGPGEFPVLDADFSDGSISTEQFEFGGGVSEAGGLLQLRRESPADYLSVRQRYGRNWRMVVEMRLNSIGWNDMYHGMSIRGDDGSGISFGFSQYGELFLATHVGGSSTSYDYGPDGSNDTGSWRSFVLTCVDGMLTIEADGAVVSGLGAVELPDAVEFDFPGFYEDGDGGAQVGITSSDIRVLRIEQP